MANTTVKELHFTTALTFINYLVNFTGPVEEPDFRSAWVFRGHHDASWKLLPPAWRDDGQKKLAPLKKWIAPRVRNIFAKATKDGAKYSGAQVKLATQCIAEFYATRQFCSLADELGQSIPDGDKMLSLQRSADTISLKALANPGGDPLSDFLHSSPFAFAQHHGIPTRFLDWTRDPLVAAFFAMDGTGKTDTRKSKKNVCVWATKQDANLDPWIKWVTVPRSSLPYLHHQHGLFSQILNPQNCFMDCGKWPQFNECLPETKAPEMELLKFTLPSSEAQEAYKELFAGRRISKAHLMPTYDNIAQISQLRWKWLGKS